MPARSRVAPSVQLPVPLFRLTVQIVVPARGPGRRAARREGWACGAARFWWLPGLAAELARRWPPQDGCRAASGFLLEETPLLRAQLGDRVGQSGQFDKERFGRQSRLAVRPGTATA